jgi:uncharacterized protein YqeY
MSLKDKLQDDLKLAMREKNDVRKATLRQTIAEIKNAEIAKRGELDDDETQALLRTLVKRRQETISELEKAARTQMLAEEKAQLDVLETYLPQMMGREQVIEVTRGVIENLGQPGPQQFGQVMKSVMSELKGKADGKLVSEVVRELLK